MISPLKKFLLITAGLLSLGLGTLGVVLPLLPTTPFLLLSSYCFIRSSKRLHDWLINHRIFGEYIYNYITHKTIKLETKILLIVLLWLSLALSMLNIDNIYVHVILAMVGTGVSIHILTLRTFVKDKIAAGIRDKAAPDKLPTTKLTP